MNTYYENYQKCCRDLETKMQKYGTESNDAKKLRGAIAVEVLRQMISEYLLQKKVSIKVSQANSYIMGSKYEYDLLLVKESADPFLGFVYQPEDVFAIIESKAGGLFDVEKNTDSIAVAVNRAKEIDANINFGYITVSENVPKNEMSNGKPTVKHWDLTQEYLEKKITGAVVYAATLHTGKNLCNEGNDEEFYSFIDHLIVK